MGCSSSKPADSADNEPVKSEDIKMQEAEGPGSAGGQKQRRLTETQRRRVAVRGETQDDLEEGDDDPGTPKTDAQTATITAALRNDSLFASLEEEQIQYLVNGFVEVPTTAGILVIKQGEQGDHFYLVESGKYEVTLQQKANEAVTTYSSGDCFGELALLYNSPRAATVKCVEAGKLWALERKKFRRVMVQGQSESLVSAANFLKAVPLLSPLSDEQRSALANVMDTLKFKDSEYIVNMGDKADAMFFIKSGEVAVHQGDTKGDLMRMSQGQVFGESCLEEGGVAQTRKANIVAVGPVTVLKLTATAFNEIIGDLKSVVEFNFKRSVMEAVTIDGTKLLSSIDPEMQDVFLSKLTQKSFESGDTVIEEGKDNDTFYIIKSGSVKVIQVDKGKGTPREVATLFEGQYFGERALLKGEPANAAIKVKDGSSLSVYCCDRATFTEYLGPLQAIIDAAIAKREAAASMPEKPKFADLELRRILGVGTFGRVKLVIHKPSGVSYALKCMRKAQVVATKQQSHVLNEKRILAMMDHPFVLRLVQTYQDKGELYMLLELALGGELFSLLAKRAPLTDGMGKFYSASVVSIFSYMHSHKVIYRDLKPENLLLDKDGYIKMVDFGFAKILQDRTWTLCGTPEYLAPEIILNKGHGFGADWWCVGILTFECLTSQTPFVANDPMEGYRKIIKCRVPWPPHLQPMAKDFIDRLLTIDPSRRLGTLKNGPKDVKSHPWFTGFNFKQLEAKQLPAPFVPKIKSSTDDSNFDHYEDEGKKNYPQDNFPRDAFAEFADEWCD
mmetsp:Transcript_28502/g.70872  ORF Transcript_28502/g.70872 Transcript_28502/m.70872 type:complete len:787 (-) Transcript_28502:604-2964(-)